MPPRSIKVVKIEPQVELVPEVKEVEVEEHQTDGSEDLEALVQEYTRGQKLKQKANEVKAQCQHCDKVMSSKSLKYSHQKNCKKDPRNIPSEPEPEPEPEPDPETDTPKKLRGNQEPQ
jgi:hypothetical protein